ncbi:Serine/threonine-protein kinase PknB [Marinomonas spartinae]|uniref:Serine/threonine-protein kinase PknB n=1 Tax=Marinomonas spartinae TaxID=1792290 RepID=A0A1A8TV16_9GAMM|nr:serine/threonine-protein kinase [Marinomonas spartinae]SBS37117.1 Serine/threonine-protein kinase PknB [Marinomonas spartinae]
MSEYRYEPLSEISNFGGMGEVAFSKDLHLDRKVAIKFLQAGVEERRFLDEQLALMQLRSKHVVQLYDVINIQGREGLVLEFIEGKDLSELDYDELGSDVLIHHLWQIACGLVDIHNHGIIHRDLKPNNVRMNEDGVIKIFDFGLSRSQSNAATKGVVGTFVFMAPELWGAGSSNFSKAVDVYAFAITALVLANKELPQELCELPPLEYIRGGKIRESLSGVDSKVVDIIEQCLSYDPAMRPSMKNVEICLRRYLLKGRHTGLFIIGDEQKYVDSSKRSTKIGLQNDPTSISIEYDGYDFKITHISGCVRVNNQIATVGRALPESSVLTFESSKSQSRAFVTFDISNPEVVV